MSGRQTLCRMISVAAVMSFAGTAAAAKSGYIDVIGAPASAFKARATANRADARIVVAEAEEHGKAKEKEKEGDTQAIPPASQIEQTPGEQYCSSVFDAASAARLAQQKSALAEAQKQIDAKIAVLATKTDELKAWIKTREDFTAHATDALVQIYSKMKPDAAATQLTAMDEMTAAAVVSKLSPKVNSLILAEMDAAKAARLSAIISGAGEVTMKPERKADAR